MAVKLTFNEGAFIELTKPEGEVDKGARMVAGRVRDRAKENLTQAGRVDSGKLRQSIAVERMYTSSEVAGYLVGSPLEYAIHQHRGVTGPIYPRRAKVLRFKPKRTGNRQVDRRRAYVFVPRVGGFDGDPYLIDAVEQVMGRL